LLTEGLGLMAAGMGMVFSFLLLLVLVMSLSARAFKRFSDRFGDSSEGSYKENIVSGQPQDSLSEIAIAIALAAEKDKRQE